MWDHYLIENNVVSNYLSGQPVTDVSVQLI